MSPRGRWSMRLAAGLFLAVVTAAPSLAKKNTSVRGWAHSEFGRLVFEWSAPVKHSAKISGRTLTVRFARPVTAPLAKAKKGLSKYLRGIDLSKNRRVLTARLKGDYKLRQFTKRNIVIIDLVRGAPATNKTRSTRARAVDLPVRTGQHQRYGRMVFDWKVPVEYTARKTKGDVDIRFRKRASVDGDRLRRRLPDQVGAVTTQTTKNGLRVRLKVAPGARIRHFRDGTRVVVDVIGKPAPKRIAKKPRTKPRREKPEAARVRTAAASPKPASAKSKPSRPKAVKPAAAPLRRKPAATANAGFVPLVTVDGQKTPSGLTLKFNWREDTALAAYRRGGKLWLFFDKPARIDVAAMRVFGRNLVGQVAQVPMPRASWVKLDVPARVNAALDRTGQAWVLRLTTGKPEDASPPGSAQVRFDRKPPGKAKVRVSVPKGLASYRAIDPDVGDELFITPSPDPKLALDRPMESVEFALLPSLAGIVVAKKADQVAVAAKGGAIEISSPGGLILSRAADAKSTRPKPGARGKRQPLSHIKEWAQRGGAEAVKEQQALIDGVIRAPKPKRNQARVKLARHYLARQKPGAAVGVLDIVRRQDLSYERNLDFRALRGAARYLLGHYGDAEADLNYSFLKKDPSVAPWLAALSAESGNWTAAHGLFKSTEPIIADYPNWLANRFSLLAAEAALVADDADAAKKRLATLRRVDLSDHQRLQLDYLQAFLLKKQGKTEEAIAQWNRLAGGKDRRVRAKAAFAATETQLEAGEIDIAAAIERMERLTYAWRGDAFEFDLLSRLGELYTKDQRHRRALNSYRQAASYFENVEGAEAMTQRMSDLFDKLYLKGGADRLPAVRALALYEEFRELTPAGKAGDEMIRRLADRLARADLLEEAAQLLDHQVQFRLEGPKKAEIGARLALIRLLDLKPEQAVDALDKSRVDGISADLQRRRSHMRARALSLLSRAPQALAALDGDNGRDAELIRVSIHWRKKAWGDAARAIGRVLKDAKPKDLGEADLRLVLQWSVALALDQNWRKLRDLRTRFGQIMEGSPQAEAFKAIVGGDADQVPDYKTLAKTAGDLGSFEAFMSSYREQVKAARPTAIN